MTRERLQKPVVTPHRQPEVTPQSRISSQHRSRGTTLSKLELHAPTPAQLEGQRQQALEVQRHVDLQQSQLEIQRFHDAQLSQARVSQATWRTSSLKTLAVQRALSDHTRTARAASTIRAEFIAQRSAQHLETFVAGRLEVELRPSLPVAQRQADLSLSHVAEHLRGKAEKEIQGDSNLIRNYQGFKNTGATLVKHFRSPGSSHSMTDLAGAIQRFTDPGQRGAVESAAFAALGHHPSFPGQLQRALDAREEGLERQRETWQRELEPIAQRQALEDASGEGATTLIEQARGGGQPLPEGVKSMLEVKWNVDLSKVRVHLDSSADGISRKLNAKALTTGNDIFFRAGTWNPTSLEGLQLIAHETWHTVQQGNGLVQAGVDRDHGLELEAQGKGNALSSTDVQTVSSSTPQVRHGDANASIRNTVVGNLNARTASPEWQALTASVWGETQPAHYQQDDHTQTKASETTAVTSTATPSGLKSNTFASSHTASMPGASVQRSSDGTMRIQRDGLVIQRFSIAGAVSSALGNIPGYKELCAVFGKDLVTGNKVEANPNAILDKLASFVPGPLKDMVKALTESKALPKAWAWFKTELNKINIGAAWNNIKKALGDASIFNPGASINRIKAAVMQPINQLKALIGGSIRKLAEIALEAIGAGFGPAAKPIIDGLKSAGGVIGEVFKNPGKFIGNLVSAVKGGFKNFTANAQKHLSSGLGQWLTGESGLAFPQNLDIKGVFTVVLSVLGISYVNFRKSLVKKLGEDKTKIAESKISLVQNLMSKGMGAAEGMKEQEGSVKGEVVEGIKTEVRNSVIQTAVTKLISMFVPGGGLIQLFITAFDMVRFFMAEGQRIFSLISSVMGSIGAIASGNISAAVAGVETSLAKSIPVALSFLSKIFKVSGIGTKIKAIINKVKTRIEQVVSRVMDKAAALVAKVVGKTPTSSKPGATTPKPASTAKRGLKDGRYGEESFTAGKEPHRTWLSVASGKPTVMIASTEKPAKEQLDGWRDEATQKGLQAQAGPYIGQGMTIVNRAVKNLNKAASTTTVDAVKITEMWKSDGKAIARTVKVIRDALGPEVNYAFTTDSSGVKRTKLVTVSFLCPKSLSQAGFRSEFVRQVEGQQEGLNKLTVPEWFTNRSSFLNAGRSNKEQREFRSDNKDAWIFQKTLEIQTRPYSQALIVQLRKVLSASEITALQDLTVSPRIPAAKARTIAAAIWSQQAALHDPDQNSGGFASNVTGMGDKDVNSSIGSQWKERVYLIDREVAKIPAVLRPDLKINTRLRSQ